MTCENCHQRPATYHMTKVVNGHKTELHLCEQCARERDELVAEPNFSMQKLLSGLLKIGMPGAEMDFDSAPRPSEPACPGCGMSYSDFARTGRVGCDRCYIEFGERMEPLLRRIHGAVQHTGKVPARGAAQLRKRREIDQLRQRLQEAVRAEQFEEAARLRDQIRQLEQEEGE